MPSVTVAALPPNRSDIEIVERKGLGHPDTICDALAETYSRNLCRFYLERYGQILHYNVDKALLCGGRSAPAFGGGNMIAPIGIILAGRATGSVNGEDLPLEEIAVEGSRAWLRSNLRALDADKHVKISTRVGPGSADLRALFSGKKEAIPRANDTSIGVGYAPFSPLEQLVLKIDWHVNSRNQSLHSAWGEDVKIMAVRRGTALELTISCAMVGRHIANLNAYQSEREALCALAQQLALEHGFDQSSVRVNAADDLALGQIYLTVTGTSAEAGDDGEVGRGNRANGLITPCRPMSLEAAAGKNPLSHVGKIYNVVAREISEELVSKLPGISAAQCLMVSRIGSPISDPALIQVQLETLDKQPAETFRPSVEEVVAAHLQNLPKLLEAFTSGAVTVF